MPESPQDFISVSPEQAREREKTWKRLASANAHFCWPPGLVDRALNHGAGETDFRALCEVAARGSAPGLSADDLSRTAETGAAGLVVPFLRHAAVRLLGGACQAPSLVEEAACAIRARFLALAPEFRPVRPAFPNWRTQGYEAFLRVRLRAAGREVRAALSYYFAEEIPPGDDFAREHGLQTEPEIGREETALAVADALRTALADSPRWDFFFQIVYRGASLREVARESGRAPSTLSEGFARPVLHALSSAFPGEGGPRAGRPSLSALARCLPEILSEERFMELVPRPQR